MRWPLLNGSLALLAGLLLAGCSARNPPPPLTPDPTRGLLADGYVPGPDGEPRPVPVVVEAPPPLPETGPIELTREECLDRAARFGQLDGESVFAWRLLRKVGELGTTVSGSRYTTSSMRLELGMGAGAALANIGFRVAILEYRRKLSCLAVAVERACWNLRSAQIALAQAESAMEKTQAVSAHEEARATLGYLLGLDPDPARRLVIRDFPLPSIPPQPETLLAQVVQGHPDLTIVRKRAEIEHGTREFGEGDEILENRLRLLHAQQVITDTEARLRNDGERLVRRWRQAQQLLTTCKQTTSTCSPGERAAARKAELDAERELGLAQIDLARWLASAEGCASAPCTAAPCSSCPGPVSASSEPSPAPG